MLVPGLIKYLEHVESKCYHHQTYDMSYIIFTTATVVLSYIAFVWWKVKKNVKLLQNIPGPPGLFLFGNVLDFTDPTKILGQVEKYIEAHGGLLKIFFLWMPNVIVADEKYVEEVLSTTKILHKSEEYEYLDQWLGTGLLTSQPEKWKKTRKIITPTFHFQILEEFLDIFDACSSIFVEKLRKEVGKPRFDVHNYVSLCTLDVICESAMGTKVNAQENSESSYVSCVKEMSRIIRERLFHPLKMIPIFYHLSRDYWKEKAALKIMHACTEDVIRRRRKELASNMHPENAGHPKKKKRLVFLDLLLQSSLDGRPMTDYEIRQEVDTFMFEGHDTTSSALTSTFYCLAHHQDVQNKVLEEQQKIFGGDKTRPTTFEDLQNMKYLEMVIKEVLRIYPPVMFYGRKVVDQFVLGDSILPKGITVTLFVWALHRNPRVFPDPEKFDPERFTLENQNKRSPFSYMPFSAGPRNCIGQRFAMLEMKTTLSKVLRKFEIHPVTGFKPQFVPDLILRSLNGVEISITERV